MKELNNESDIDIFKQSEYLYTEEDAIKERELMLDTCYSCKNFISLIGESGLCKLKNNCLCKNPKSLIDMFDFKCEKWIVCDREKDFYNTIIK